MSGRWQEQNKACGKALCICSISAQEDIETVTGI